MWPDWAIFESLDDNFYYKSSQNIWWLLGCLKISVANVWATFGQMDYFYFLNGPTPASFSLFFYRKIVDFRGIRTRIVRSECEHTDHLTTTSAQMCYFYYIFWSHWVHVRGEDPLEVSMTWNRFVIIVPFILPFYGLMFYSVASIKASPIVPNSFSQYHKAVLDCSIYARK